MINIENPPARRNTFIFLKWVATVPGLWTKVNSVPRLRGCSGGWPSDSIRSLLPSANRDSSHSEDRAERPGYLGPLTLTNVGQRKLSCNDIFAPERSLLISDLQSISTFPTFLALHSLRWSYIAVGSQRKEIELKAPRIYHLLIKLYSICWTQNLKHIWSEL